MSESTPEKPSDEQIQQLVVLGEQLKLTGNRALQSGNITEALTLYTQGIEAALATGDRGLKLLSQLYSNRAAVRLTQKSFVEVIDDSRKAISSDSGNLKAYWRAARACVDLDLYQQAVDFCQQALAQDSSHKDIQALLLHAGDKLKTYREKKSVENRGFTEEEAVNAQNVSKHLAEQLYLINQKIMSCEYEDAKHFRTVSLLAEMGAGTPCYKSLGRGFVLESKDSITNELESRCLTIRSSELPELVKTKETIEKRKANADSELKEIIEYFKRQQQQQKQ